MGDQEHAAVFHMFPRLPPELRYYIWRIALADWSATMVFEHDGNIRLDPFGWDMSIIGQTCHEARSAMKGVYSNIGPRTSQGDNVWVDFEANIFCLGPASTALNAIKTLDEDICSRVTCVAITWTSWLDISRCFKQFSLRWRALRSIVIFDANSPIVLDPLPFDYGHVASIIAYYKDPRPHDSWWMDTLRSSRDLQEWFRPAANPPSVDFLPL